jgi:5'-nucleotidase
MTWMQTHSGRAWDLRAPDPDNIALGDIAHALARINRFLGHTDYPYSVAEHSVRVMMAVETEEPQDRDLHLAALLHDAHEAYVGDWPTPIKRTMSREAEVWWADLEQKHLAAIEKWAGITPRESDDELIKAVDLRMLVTERRDLMKVPPRDWGIDVDPYPMADVSRPWDVDHAEHNFKRHFVRLQRLRGRA